MESGSPRGEAETSDSELVLELPNDIHGIANAVEFVMEHCASCHHHARRFRFNFRVGLTEALSNAILYGNGPDPAKRVKVEVTVKERRVTARITDEGDGFDPALVPNPTTPANLTRSCGRGLFLMRELMDEVYFNERGNAVTIVLRLDTEAEKPGRPANRT